MRRQVDLFLCAVQFLTRFPIPALKGFEPDWVTRSSRYFPLVGQMVGALSAGVWLAGSQVWPPWLAATVAVGAGVLATGAFHEDGLADTADGLGGGGDRARRLEIMKDSRIGTYGALALGLVTAVRVGAVASLPAGLGAMALVAGHGAARAAAVLTMRALAYVGAASPKWTPSQTAPRVGELAIALALAVWPFAFLPLGGVAVAVFSGTVAAGLLAMTARRLIGGYTGDVLGAVEQLFEAAFLAGLAASVGCARC